MSIIGLSTALEVRAAIREVGFEVFLTPADTGGVPWSPSSAATDPISVFVVQENYRNTEIDGSLIRSGDKKLLMEPEVVFPKTGDIISVQGVEHRVESVSAESPSGLAVMFEVQVRKI